MNRPLRLEYSGALYHITARGDRRDSIYRSDSDRLTWLSLLGETCDRYNFTVHAYCQMTNHYHLLLETVDGQLARGMRNLNGNYSQYFNRKHALVGHVFQGRYKAIVCQGNRYMQELSRYIELNPVRGKMVTGPEQWPWSSYRAAMGLVDAPEWLRSDAVLAYFGDTRPSARAAYAQFVAAGIDAPSPLRGVSNMLILGDDAFRTSVIDKHHDTNMLEIKRTQRRAIVLPLHEYFRNYRDPKEAMARAYLSLGYSMAEVAEHARVSVKTVSRAVDAFMTEQTTS